MTPRGIGDSGGRAPAIGTVAPVGTEGPGGGFLATDGVALERGVTVPYLLPFLPHTSAHTSEVLDYSRSCLYPCKSGSTSWHTLCMKEELPKPATNKQQ